MKTLGKHPQSVSRTRRIKNSVNYQQGSFQNINTTPSFPEGSSFLKVAWKYFLTKKPEDIKPAHKITGKKTNLFELKDDTPTLVWFGHSSYLIKFQGKNFLIDPVFSGHASPVPGFIKAFSGSDIYFLNDLPFIDFLILTHDHYDHIDFKTITQLVHAQKIICPLGVGEHLQYWGFPEEKIIELDWWQHQSLSENIKITATPARHFSGRGLTRNKTLWSSFVLEIAEWKIFIGGDSGYDNQFKKIGDAFKTFDLALLECGQYNENWPLMHMFPEQTAQAAMDLNAKVLLPVHWSKFILSTHSWTEPIERLLLRSETLGLNLTTPEIGEPVQLGKKLPNKKWWRLI